MHAPSAALRSEKKYIPISKQRIRSYLVSLRLTASLYTFLFSHRAKETKGRAQTVEISFCFLLRRCFLKATKCRDKQQKQEEDDGARKGRGYVWVIWKEAAGRQGLASPRCSPKTNPRSTKCCTYGLCRDEWV
jgi:hypothetical protein